MKIAILAPNLSSDGGVPRVAKFLYDAVRAEGGEAALIDLATSAGNRCSRRILSPRNWFKGPIMRRAQWHDLGTLESGSEWAELEFCRYRPTRALRETLSHFDLVQIVAGYPAWAGVARGAGRPLCLQVATLAAAERKGQLERDRSIFRPWRRLMTKITSRLDERNVMLVDRVFVENAWMQRWAERVCGPERVFYAPPGVDCGIFQPSEKIRRSYLLSFGRLGDERKNHGLLLRAYARMVEMAPGIPPLVIAGRGEFPVALRSLQSQLGLEQRVSVRADVPERELPGLYAGAVAFLLSSDEEGFGLVLLEAMACGVPVISTDCGGPAEIVTADSGCLVPKGDAEALAKATVDLLGDSERLEQAGRAARRRVAETFSIQQTGRQFLETYKQLLETKEPLGAERSLANR